MLREETNVVPQSPKYSWQTGSTTAYKIDKKGMISVLSPDVLTGVNAEGGEIANCWIEVSPDKNIFGLQTHFQVLIVCITLMKLVKLN